MDWQYFLREQAGKRDLSPEETETLSKRFPEKDRHIKNEAQFTNVLNEGITEKRYQVGPDAITQRMRKIYKKFDNDCPELQTSSRGKLEILRQFLIREYETIQNSSSNRCILGLKGSYQEAQQKIGEITQELRTLLNDDTLSLTLEEGSIILIIESTQTDYNRVKQRLLGQEVAGFPVEYAIDEWQDICRRMLLDRKPLSSNTVIGQVYGNRNLIDEDLFVDLALVKPKRSENPKHPQEIDPEKGSDLYNREEVEKRFAYGEFLDEVIGQRTEKRLAIIGEPGAGKTTLLQKLAFWLLQETDDLVVWVSLAELGSQPLGEYLEQKWLPEALRQSREEIKADWGNKFEGGAVWLLLDGLDEMSQTDLQGLKFRGWVTDARMIVTCRLNLWQANPSQLQGFKTYLTHFSYQDMHDEAIELLYETVINIPTHKEIATSNLWSMREKTDSEYLRLKTAYALSKLTENNQLFLNELVTFIAISPDISGYSSTVNQARLHLKEIASKKQMPLIVNGLKYFLSSEIYSNEFERFDSCFDVIWNCAENLPYPEFYRAWHNPPTTPHPEVTEQTPHSGEPSFASPLTWESLQHLPLYCLNADLLADETREREIALTLSELIWEITCPDEAPPEPATPAELRRHLKTLKRRNLLPHRAILFGSETVSTPTQPTPELIAFCQKLTGVIAVAFLTDDPLEAPLKGFPPNQPNLISAIETWLFEKPGF